MYHEEEGEEINPKKYLKVVGIDWVKKKKIVERLILLN